MRGSVCSTAACYCALDSGACLCICIEVIVAADYSLRKSRTILPL